MDRLLERLIIPLLILSAATAFPIGLILAFYSGKWQWLTFPLLSFIFFHALLKRTSRW